MPNTMPMPAGARRIDAAEAIRRIHERDHYVPSGQSAPFLADEVIIALIRKGAVLTALGPDNQLLFWPVDLESGEPFDPNNPQHRKNGGLG